MINPSILPIWRMGYQQAIYGLWLSLKSCIFAGLLFSVLILSHYVPTAVIARYDFILLSAFIIQAIMLITGLETKQEFKAILLFHVLGFTLEAFKVSPPIASWSYPESAHSKIWGVPLYAGFMYAAVASCVVQAIRYFKVTLHHYPSHSFCLIISFLIYINFFTHHYWFDLRWGLAALVLAMYYQTYVFFILSHNTYKIHLVTLFILFGLLIWLAENIATYYQAWVYPNQISGWVWVSMQKISAWSLLFILTFTLVMALLNIQNQLEKH